MDVVWERAVGWVACAGAVVLLVVALAAVRVEAAAGIRVDNAVVRLAAAPGRPSAGYFTVAGGPATLTAVSSPLATRIELHSSMMTGGVMRMEPLRSVSLRAGETLRFAPGGNHLMIFGLTGLKPGAPVPLDFRFADGKTVRVTARAVAPGADAMPMPHGMH